ncbi:MAG: restriction endonuclease subunit S [Erythrobacter sp.]
MSGEVAELERDVDALPEGWRSLRLGDVARLGGGTTPSRNEPDYWETGTIPWATPSDITSLSPGASTIDSTENMVTDRALAECSLPLNPPGTVLMTSRATIGYAAINTVPMTTNQGFITFSASRDLDPVFLLHWLIAQRGNLVAAAGGSTFKELSRGTAKLLPILLPPLDEQRRIAEVLRSVDEAIAAQTGLCSHLRQTADDLADELFGQEIADCGDGLTPYGDACETVQVGIVIKPASYYVDGGGVPALRSTNIRRNEIDFSALVQLSQEGHQINRKSSLRPGDVVTIRTGEPGKTAVIPGDAPSPLNCIDIIFSRPKPKLRPYFAAYFINSGTARRQIGAMQGGLAQQHFNVGEMKKLKIPVPDLARQDRVVEVMDAAWRMVRTEEAQLSTLQATKAALMSDLLSGRVRVPA